MIAVHAAKVPRARGNNESAWCDPQASSAHVQPENAATTPLCPVGRCHRDGDTPPPNDDTSRIAFRGDRARGRVCGTGRPASGQHISAMRREPLAKLGNPIVAGDKFLRNVVSDCIEHRCIRRVARCALVIRMQCLRGERRGFDVEHCKRRPTSAIYGRSVAHTRPWRRRLHQASSSGAAATMASPLSAMPYITATKTYPCFCSHALATAHDVLPSRMRITHAVGRWACRPLAQLTPVARGPAIPPPPPRARATLDAASRHGTNAGIRSSLHRWHMDVHGARALRAFQRRRL